ncbi:hypothetical protein MTO96_046342, partial [Rhipicephalus appendiculatus]
FVRRTKGLATGYLLLENGADFHSRCIGDEKNRGMRNEMRKHGGVCLSLLGSGKGRCSVHGPLRYGQHYSGYFDRWAPYVDATVYNQVVLGYAGHKPFKNEELWFAPMDFSCGVLKVNMAHNLGNWFDLRVRNSSLGSISTSECHRRFQLHAKPPIRTVYNEECQKILLPGDYLEGNSILNAK